MINFEYSSPTKIIFGEKSIEKLEEQLINFDVKNLLFVYGGGSIKKNGIYDYVLNTCDRLGIRVVEEKDVRPNPDMTSVYNGIQKCKDNQVDFILSAGGGSAIDCAKAIGLGAKFNGDIWSVYRLENIVHDSLPVGVIITLAATGTETNGNSVISNDQRGEKRSVNYKYSIPKFAIIDPTYTLSVNNYYTIAGGIDIILHVLEQYFSNTERTETSDYMSIGIMQSVIENIKRIRSGKDGYQTRANLSWASTIGLNWILGAGKIGDWASHRLSYAITKEYGTTHGYALSTIYYSWLMNALKHNEEVMTKRLQLLGEKLFNEKDFKQVPLKIKKLFKSWGAPVSFSDIQVDMNEKLAIDLAKNAVELGSVGTIYEINEIEAKEIFLYAK